MVPFNNPALETFVTCLIGELVFAQVLICRTAEGFELRHVADRAADAAGLRLLAVNELRALAQTTRAGAFRPLKAAPNLPSGWRVCARNATELETALNQLYPGALADWFAAQNPAPPVTHYREFTNRQSGMYRITALLPDAQAAQVIRAGCAKEFCLKRRWWTVDGLPVDAATEKSLIPCLEPCAVLLEFARKAMRIEQEEKPALPATVEEAAARDAELQAAHAQPDDGQREADFDSPRNPRRLQLLREKLAPLLKPAGSGKSR